MLNEDVLYSTLRELGEALRARKFSAVDLAESYLARLERLGPRLNAVVTVTRDLALDQARLADQEIAAGKWRGPLHGIPYGAKDLLSTKGIKTTWGCRAYADQVPNEDATVVRLLREAGAVLIAKVAMVELAGGAGYSFANASLTGPGLNPWNPGFWAGGSSSGSGAGVSAALMAFSIGSETWGSIIGPASLCGISGFRPTYGLVSRHGAMAVAWTLDKLGPFARSAEDCALVLEAIAGKDPADPTSVNSQFRRGQEKPSLRGLRIGHVVEDFPKYGEFEVERAYEKTLHVLEDGGATVRVADLPPFPYSDVATTVVNAEASAAFEELVQTGRTDQIIDSQGKVSFYAARLISAADYLKCMRIRAEIQAAYRKLFERFDVLVAPGQLIVAPPIEGDLNQSFRGGGDIEAAGNLAGLPALTVPCGFGKHQLPVGLQIVGKAFDDAAVLAVGEAFQSLTDWHRQRPPV